MGILEGMLVMKASSVVCGGTASTQLQLSFISGRDVVVLQIRGWYISTRN